ncbi:MAG: type VI secretion system-associated FHA domain protein TagH [Rubrivivax sp.]|nr:MAG: type VI secretion system-associated FHA domain protein TagH [Rubrivivax sp.]
MNLMLSAVTHNDHRLTSPITAVFDAAGGTVGRADHCTLALPDPERFISRKQAEVVAVTGGLFLIRNVGGANPIVIGQRSLTMNESAVLQDGDVVRIAGYELQVSYTTQAPTPAPAVLQRAPMPSAAPRVPPAPPVPLSPLSALSPLSPLARSTPSPAPLQAAPAATANPFDDLLAPAPQLQGSTAAQGGGGNPFDDLLSLAPQRAAAPRALTQGAPAAPGSSNPFDDLLGGPLHDAEGTTPMDLYQAPSTAPQPDIVPAAAGLSRVASPAPSMRSSPLPDDFDPFALPPVSARGPAPAGSSDPFALVQPSRPASIDQQFGLRTTSASQDPMADFLRPATAGALLGGSGAALPGDDILAGLAPPPAAVDSMPADSDRLAPLHDAFEPPRRALEKRADRPLAASPAAPAHDVAALWQAFCRGADIQVAAPADEAQLAQRMEHLGRIVKAAVAGTQELMAVRASTKYEMRAQVTQIQARSNNPLKFAPDVRTGVEQLVEPAARGFLDGPAAMEDAMKDLIGHMIGSVAGMRAALEGLLDRFTPEMLEQTLGQGSMLGNLLPASRKAKLWELYLLRYTTLRESAQDDFHAVFGKAFLGAYEQQVERLRKKGGQS